VADGRGQAMKNDFFAIGLMLLAVAPKSATLAEPNRAAKCYEREAAIGQLTSSQHPTPHRVSALVLDKLQIPPASLHRSEDLQTIRDNYARAEYEPAATENSERYRPLLTYPEAKQAAQFALELARPATEGAHTEQELDQLAEYIFRRAHGLAYIRNANGGHSDEFPTPLSSVPADQTLALIDRSILHVMRHTEGIRVIPVSQTNAPHPMDPNFATKPVTVFVQGDHPLPNHEQFRRQSEKALNEFTSGGEGHLFVGDIHLEKNEVNQRRLDSFVNILSKFPHEGKDLNIPSWAISTMA
jgi:hypothetical protein